MAQSIFSSSWYRVSALKPRLRSHAQVHRHRYRGETWYVLQDLTAERFLRFSPAAYTVIGLMEGVATLEEIWQRACTRLGDDAPTQDEMLQILSQLYRADVLQCDVTPDVAELLQRHDEQTRRQRQGRLLSFFSWRLPLFDPDRFLRLFLPGAKLLFGSFGAVLWLAVVIPGSILFATHWSDLTMGVLDRVLVAQNLFLLWLLFPVIKAFHEFGHAFATKTFGGEVHDMGVMFLVFTPVPYVDASSASAFGQKWRRVIVGAAGMLVEVFIASLALFLWLAVQPGLVRTLAYNTILIAGVTTVLFNANPLLRYDGYYILADYLEIPNLRSRATAYLGYLCERYLFGNAEAQQPLASPSERVWFVLFGVLSFLYRIFVVVAILLYVSNKLFNLGAILAVAVAVAWAVFPVAKGFHFIFTSPRLRPVRARSIAVTSVILTFVLGFLTLVPLPYRTITEGIVWIPEEAIVRAGAEGFVEEVLSLSGARVERGTPLFRLANPVLAAQKQTGTAHIQELQARYIQHLSSDTVKAETTLDELRHAKKRLARLEEQLTDLTVVSRIGGSFIIPTPQDLPARFVRQGDLLGYVVELDRIIVRALLPQATIDLFRSRTYAVQIRLSERLDETFSAVVRRIVPGASEKLPARSLGSAGGGEVALSPADPEGLTAVEKLFQVDLEIRSKSKLVNLGGRGYVRFDHGWAPLAVQWYLNIRQLFLSHLNV